MPAATPLPKALHAIGNGLPPPTYTGLKEAAEDLHILTVDKRGRLAIPDDAIPVFRAMWRLAGCLRRRGAHSIEELKQALCEVAE